MKITNAVTKQFLTLSISYYNLGGKLAYLKEQLLNDIEIFSEVWGEYLHNKQIDGYSHGLLEYITKSTPYLLKALLTY